MEQMAWVSAISSPSTLQRNTSQLLMSELGDGLMPLDSTQTTNPVFGWEEWVGMNAV